MVFVEPFPGRQLSWHFPLEQLHLVEALPVLPNVWDEHTTRQKRQRLHQFIVDRAGPGLLGRSPIFTAAAPARCNCELCK